MRTYITPRDTEYVICRMGMIYITAGEPFYLRQLILNRTGRTFDDFKTVVDITLPTYQDACYALGIIEAKEEANIKNRTKYSICNTERNSDHFLLC